MESLKKPETLLLLATLVAGGGGAYYFNKQIKNINEEIEKLTKDLRNVVIKTGELSTNVASHPHVFKQIDDLLNKIKSDQESLNKKIVNLTDVLNELESDITTNFEDLYRRIDAMDKAIIDLGGTINVNAPPPPISRKKHKKTITLKNKPKKKSKKVESESSNDEDDDSDEDITTAVNRFSKFSNN